MAKRKASTEAAAAAPLPIETPKIETSAEPARIEMPQVEPMAELLKVESFKARIKDDEVVAETEANLEAQPPAWRRHAPLAASVALAAVLGAIAGAAATSAFSKPTPSPTTKAATTIADETRALKESVVRLSTELATVRAGADVAHRNTAAQLNKLADRFDRAEKAQAEPAARLAKIAESLDRIERRPATAAAASDVTGSVTVVEKQDGKPPVIDGWKLLEFYAGRAVVENRSGGLYEIGPGSSLPGLGKVESIKRQDGRVVITTPKGVIVSALEQPRRPPHYLPRY